MKFNGDIIITDPCYIMKKPDYSKMPKYEDFFSHLRKEIDENGEEHNYYDESLYPDARDKTIEEYLEPYLSIGSRLKACIEKKILQLKRKRESS